MKTSYKFGAVVGVMLVAVAVWFVADYFVSERAVGNIQKALAKFEGHSESKHGLDVIRLDYNKDDKTIRYRLRYRPDSTDRIHPIIGVLQGPEKPSLSAAGELVVGKYSVLDWLLRRPIRINGKLLWPDGATDALPDWQHENWARILIDLNRNGTIGISLYGEEYDGQAILTKGGEESAEVFLEEWSTNLILNSEGRFKRWHGNFPTVWVESPGVLDLLVDEIRWDVQNLGEGEIIPFGVDTNFEVGRVRGETSVGQFLYSDIHFGGSIQEDGSRIIHKQALGLGRLRVDGGQGLDEFNSNLSFNLPAKAIEEAFKLQRKVEKGEYVTRVEMEVFPMNSDDALHSVGFSGRIFDEIDIVAPGGGDLTVELIDFSATNTQRLRNNAGEEVNLLLGPRVDFRLVDPTGGGTYYRNYQNPVPQGGARYFLSGVRESSTEEFSYVFLPADADDSLERFRAYLTMLQDDDVRNEIARQVARDDDSVPDEENQAIARTTAELMGLFAEGGYAAVDEEIERRLSPGRSDEVRDLMIRILHAGLQGLYMEVLHDEGVVSIQKEEQRFLEDTIFAINALNLYGSPYFILLVDHHGVVDDYFEILKSALSERFLIELDDFRVRDSHGNVIDASLKLDTGEAEVSPWSAAAAMKDATGSVQLEADWELLELVANRIFSLDEEYEVFTSVEPRVEKRKQMLRGFISDVEDMGVGGERISIDWEIRDGVISVGDEQTKSLYELMDGLTWRD